MVHSCEFRLFYVSLSAKLINLCLFLSFLFHKKVSFFVNVLIINNFQIGVLT